MSALSRREFMVALLGESAALAACGTRTPGVPDGELLLPGKAAGHRLRDGGGDPEPPPERFERASVVIVGGGPAGLCAAWWLRRAGVEDLVVLELEDVPGGTSRAGSSAISGFPWGAHYVVAPLPEQTNFVALLSEMGVLEPGAGATVAEETLCREPEERIFHHGRWYDGLYLRAGASPEDLAQLARFQEEMARWVAFRDGAGRRAFALPASSASLATEVTSLDQQSFGAWLDGKALTSTRLRWLADYACRDDYGLLAADTSAWAGISYFASRIGVAGEEPQPVVTWPEGNGRIVAHLARSLAGRLRLGQAVSSVRSTEGEVVVTARGPAGVVGIRAERVIMATPTFINQRVVAGLKDAQRPKPIIDRGAWAVANLHLETRPRGRLEDAPLSWDNVLYDSPSLGYVVATHQAGRDHGPTVLTWYYPFTGEGRAARTQLDGANREDWAEVALADLSRAHPDIRAICRRVDVAYWGHGMARPRVGSVFHPGLAAARMPFGRVHFAGSELSGLSLFEEALDHGVRAAEEVRGVLGGRT